MRLLVTTSWSVLDVDIDSRTIIPVHRNEGLYFGIAPTGTGGYFVAARRRMIVSDRTGEEERGVILEFDRTLAFQREIVAPFPLRDLHGLALIDGQLWATCSRDNFVAIHDLDESWSRWYPFPDDPSHEKDVRHYNGISLERGEIQLVAHNFGDSDIHYFDRTTRAHLRTVHLGCQTHNAWTEAGELLTCSSGDGAVLGSKGFRMPTGDFPRGYVALPDGRRIVGINKDAPRAERDATDSTLRIYGPAWEFLSELKLPGEGMVLELRALPPTPVTWKARARPWVRRARKARRAFARRARSVRKAKKRA